MRTICAALVATTTVLVSAATAQSYRYLATLIDDQGIQIEGSSALPRHEGKIECLEFDYGVTVPYDAATGLPTGQRRHSPVTLLKRVDKATPLIFKAETEGRLLKEATFEFLEPLPSGAEAVFYTVKLSNARIVGMTQVVSQYDRAGLPSELPFLVESVKLLFQRIELTIADGGITASDDVSGRIGKQNGLAGPADFHFSFRKGAYRVVVPEQERPYAVRFMDLNGRTMGLFSGTGPMNFTASSHALSRGLYLVRFTTSDPSRGPQHVVLPVNLD